MKKLTPVSHLLAEAEGMLQKLRRGTAEADRTLAALQRILPPEIAREVWSASRRGATLTAFVQTAAWGTSLLLPILPGSLTFLPMRPLDSIDLDWRVLGFTAALSVVSGVLFGLAPAVSAFRDDLANPLKEQARGAVSGPRSRLRYGLVASEVALTLVTLAGAGVMILSVSRLLGVDPGLDPRNVLVMEMSLPQADLYYGPPDHAGFCRALDAQVRSIPGVLSVSAIGHLPIGGGAAGRSFGIEGQPDPGSAQRPGA